MEKNKYNVIMKIFMIDHCSYAYNLSSCEIKPWKKNAGTGIKEVMSLNPVQAWIQFFKL